MDITTLSFENVRFHQYDTESCHLYFTIQGYHFYLFLYQKEDILVPQYVQHCEENEEDDCPCCDSSFEKAFYKQCSFLSNYLYDVFYLLISFPSIRLHFLYLPYPEKESV